MQSTAFQKRNEMKENNKETKRKVIGAWGACLLHYLGKELHFDRHSVGVPLRAERE
jgi:hypothetical protein